MQYYVVVITYEVWDKYREQYLEAMEKVKDNALKLGAVAYYLAEDDDVPNKFTETIVFDSWSHFKLVQQKQLSSEMQRVFDDVASWTIGGIRETEVQYKKVLLGETWKSMLHHVSGGEGEETDAETEN